MEIWLVAAVVVTAAVAIFSLLSRRTGDVIDAPRQATASAATPAGAADTGDMSAGDLLKAEGADEPLEHFADWLEGEASEELGVAVEAPGPTRRIADAARAAMPMILTQGRGVVELPGLLVDATGGRDFRREIDIAQLEQVVSEAGLFDVHQLTDWRKDPPRVKALAAWLSDIAFHDMPEDAERTEYDSARMVEAARGAVAEIDRTGRADIALPAIGENDKKEPFDIHRSVDTKELETIVAEFEENEKTTTRTYTRS
jgi:hypothetical protein